MKCESTVATVHEGKKPFRCVTCDFSFSGLEDLNNHISAIDEGKKPFKCVACNISYSGNEDLNKHMNAIHKGKKHIDSVHRKLKVLAVNIRGIECSGRMDQIQILLEKYQISVAALTETEITHTLAQTTNIEGFKAICPPASVTGPYNKEVGVILLISNMVSSGCKPRPDINSKDSIQTVWVELINHDLIIGGVYRRARPSPELEKIEFAQLSNQILRAASTGKKVLVLGDLNIDHTNPYHKKAKEAHDLLSDLEAANMRRLPSSVPTWQSYGLHKVFPCPTINQEEKNCTLKGRAPCGCLKGHYTNVIDNAYLSLSEAADLHVLEEAISDHFPILVSLVIKAEPKARLIPYFKEISPD